MQAPSLHGNMVTGKLDFKKPEKSTVWFVSVFLPVKKIAYARAHPRQHSEQHNFLVVEEESGHKHGEWTCSCRLGRHQAF